MPTIAAYYRREAEYRAQSRYNSLYIYDKTIGVVDVLVRKGYIDHVKGHYSKAGDLGSHMSRMRATPKPISLIADNYGITEEMVDQPPHRECIHLRDFEEAKKKQVDIEYKDMPEIRRMRDELYAYTICYVGPLLTSPIFLRRAFSQERKNVPSRLTVQTNSCGVSSAEDHGNQEVVSMVAGGNVYRENGDNG